jgi:hypothetical protein
VRVGGLGGLFGGYGSVRDGEWGAVGNGRCVML